MATLKNLPRRAILTIHGRATVVEKLGSGRFTTAWQVVGPKVKGQYDKVYLQVKKRDNSKEIMAHMQGNIHIPTLERVDFIGDDTLYVTQYYHPLKAQHKEAWKQYKILKNLIEKEWYSCVTRGANRIYKTNEGFACAAACNSDLPTTLQNAIYELSDWCNAYEGYLIEIAVRNLAVDDNGTLILLDPCFNWTELYGPRN
jgi:hypothetical protein